MTIISWIISVVIAFGLSFLSHPAQAEQTGASVSDQHLQWYASCWVPGYILEGLNNTRNPIIPWIYSQGHPEVPGVFHDLEEVRQKIQFKIDQLSDYDLREFENRRDETIAFWVRVSEDGRGAFFSELREVRSVCMGNIERYL